MVGARFDEARVLRAAQALEAQLGFPSLGALTNLS